MSSATTTGRTGSAAARTAAPTRARRRRPAPATTLDGLFARPADGSTFDDLIAGAWEDLSAHRTVTCPVCQSAAMRPRYGAGTVGGRCGDCGSVLG